MRVSYICSDGTEIEMYSENLRATEGSWHIRQWTPQVTVRQYGDAVKGWSKTSVNFPLTLTLRGSLEERYAQADELTELFEKDIINQTPGRLVYGDYYIRGYAITGETKKSTYLSYARSDVSVNFYAPYPFWCKEQETSFPAVELPEIESDYLDYPFDYEYDYAANAVGTSRIIVDHYSPCDFLMTVYGPCSTPTISIAGHTYRIWTSLNEGEYLQIDSRENTVYKFHAGGIKENIYSLRDTTSSVFEKIPAGTSEVVWLGTFGFDVTVFLERSEPTWS